MGRRVEKLSGVSLALLLNKHGNTGGVGDSDLPADNVQTSVKSECVDSDLLERKGAVIKSVRFGEETYNMCREVIWSFS